MPAPELSRRMKAPLEENRWKLPRSWQPRTLRQPPTDSRKDRHATGGSSPNHASPVHVTPVFAVLENTMFAMSVPDTAQQRSGRRRSRPAAAVLSCVP
eukprot:3937766-Rhodomonas_salina.2